jgi:WD40 repeat protein
MWEVATGRRLFFHAALPKAARAVAFHPDGAMLATVLGYCADEAHVVELRDVHTGRVLESFPARNGNHTRGLAFSPDGTRLAIGGRAMKIWDVAGRREVVVLNDNHPDIGPLVFSRDGHRIAGGSYDGTALVWDASPVDVSPASPGASVSTIDGTATTAPARP